MTTVSPNIQAFDAFENQLKSLCIAEFPCGIGSWRENHKKKRSLIEKDKVVSKFVVTLKDYGPEFEKTETLEGLVTEKKSPWNLDYSWSDEAKQLREIAVRSPWLIDERFVMGHFRTLRIIDKGVTAVDDNVLKFSNLQELTLSANLMRTCNSQNLPRNLKVLELCANKISHLADLCTEPPPLIHLGLGYNKLTMVEDYLTGDYWPELLSLDLSHNNLCDMMDIIRKLQTLPKLRNLVLQGNPLALVPAYRGYTIDSIKKLDILDDIPISADEKHHYKGLTKRKEYILDEAKVIFTVDYIKGIPMPEEMKNPEEQPEYPIITRKYFVQFLFLEDRSANAQIFQLLYDDQITLSSEQQTASIVEATFRSEENGTLQNMTEENAEAETLPQKLTDSLGNVSLDSGAEKNVNFAQEVHTQEEGEPTKSPSPVGSLANVDEAADSEEALEEDQPPLKLAPVKSSMQLWAEEMEYNWRKICNRDDLLAMRNFLKQGMDIAVMEEKVLSNPAEQDAPPGTGNKEEKNKDKGKDKGKDDKGKTRKKSAQSVKSNKSTKDPKESKKKKKGEPEIPLQHSEPEYTTIATFHIPLADFLEGDFTYENVFSKSMEEEDTSRQTPSSEVAYTKHGKKEKKAKEAKKEKPPSAKKAKDPKAAEKSKGGKDAQKGAKGPETLAEDEPLPQPPPLEVKVGFTLHHWETANDSLKEETEAENEDENQGSDAVN